MLKKYHIKNLNNILILITIIFIFLMSVIFVKYFDNNKKFKLASCGINTSVKSFKSFNKDFNLIHEDGFLISRKQLIDQPSLI